MGTSLRGYGPGGHVERRFASAGLESHVRGGGEGLGLQRRGGGGADLDSLGQADLRIGDAAV